MRRSLVIRLALGACALAIFGFLFMRSLRETRAAPYTVERPHLTGWTIALEPAPNSSDPLLVLRPVPALAGELFRQVFARAMESLNAPVGPGIPLVLRGEFDRVVGDQLTQEDLAAMARAAGLESAPISPRCLVHRRESEPGRTRQVYFVVFDAPSVLEFRRQVGLDPAALSSVLFVAGAGADFNSWLPQRVNVDADCLAPVEIAG